jgi:hypothetical protein
MFSKGLFSGIRAEHWTFKVRRSTFKVQSSKLKVRRSTFDVQSAGFPKLGTSRMCSWLIALFLIGSPLSASSPVLPLPDLLVYGLVPRGLAQPLPVNAEWTLTYDGQVLSDLPVDFFVVAGLTYYVASVPSIYTVSGTVPVGHLQVSQGVQPLSISFQSIDGATFLPGAAQATFDYSISELGTLYRLDLIEPAYQEWLDDKYLQLPDNSLLDPNLDSDGDGFTNQAEFLAGTDPYQIDIFPGMINRDWWIKRGVLDTDLAPQNRSLVALGQLKNMAFQGLEEVREKYPTVAPLIEADLALVFDLNSSNSANNLAAANLGQLKAVSHPFYQHLNLLKPWSVDQLPGNFELAALGQLKHLFDFPIQSQADYFLDYGARYNDSSLLIQPFPAVPPFGDQDFGSIALESDGSIHLDGNAWKLLELPNGPNAYLETPQDVELNPTHVLSFEFKKSGPTAEVYAIGLYHAASGEFALAVFGGTRADHGIPVFGDQLVADEDWRKLVIPMGQLAEDAGTLSQFSGQLMLVLINDADEVYDTHSYYRNIRLIDYSK